MGRGFIKPKKTEVAYIMPSNYPKHTVYLAGPITGLDHDGAANRWRMTANRLISARYDHIFCSSPMRGKEMLKDFGILTSGRGYPKDPMLTPNAITKRDKNDVKTCSVLLAVFEDSKGISGGTFMEFGWADAWDKPIIIVGDPDDPNVKHLMVESVRAVYAETLEEAVEIIGFLLTPGV